jgi:hypothetical protein
MTPLTIHLPVSSTDVVFNAFDSPYAPCYTPPSSLGQQEGYGNWSL